MGLEILGTLGKLTNRETTEQDADLGVCDCELCRGQLECDHEPENLQEKFDEYEDREMWQCECGACVTVLKQTQIES
jgi:hypothetical protein